MQPKAASATLANVLKSLSALVTYIAVYNFIISSLQNCFPFSALTLLSDRKGIRPVKKLGVGLLVVTFSMELYMSYSSSYHHRLHHP